MTVEENARYHALDLVIACLTETLQDLERIIGELTRVANILMESIDKQEKLQEQTVFLCGECGAITREKDYETYEHFKALKDLGLCERCARKER